MNFLLTGGDWQPDGSRTARMAYASPMSRPLLVPRDCHSLVTPMSHKLCMHAADPAETPPRPPRWPALHSCGDEAVLPAGTNLVIPTRPGRHCYLVLDGVAIIEWPDGTTSRVGSGSFIAGVDADGRPKPLSDVTVRLESHGRILVCEPDRLAAVIDSDSDARAASLAMPPQPGSEPPTV